MSVVSDENELANAVHRAKAGDRDALEEVIKAVQHDVYRLALRMTAHVEDARDATQEILIKVITRLDGFRGESSIRTWTYRIAVRHLLDRKRSFVEELALDFERFGADLGEGLSSAADPDPLLAEEVKLGCTLAMLTCIDRPHRIAYVLSEVFDLENAEAASLCEVSEETYRQRLSRARRAIESFTRAYCGLVSADANCACSRRVERAVKLGRVDRQRLQLADPQRLKRATSEMQLLHTTAELMRAHPEYRAPEAISDWLRKTMRGSNSSIL
jgi:RNA polymerase sigma factor (sigma-70 family)